MTDEPSHPAPTPREVASDFWSTSDFVYMCLRDRRRTLAFRAALRASIKPGDRVADIGSGSGILALMAAEAGAGEVLAVEHDPALARRLVRSVALNGYADRITVLHGDVFALDLPPCDLVVAEMIETALIDEAQIPVHNALVERGVIHAGTTVVPGRYTSHATLVRTQGDFYGFDLDVVRHEWPFYADDTGGHWSDAGYVTRSVPVELWSGAFGPEPLSREVQVSRVVDVTGDDAVVDALRLSGDVHLATGNTLAACPAMNGDKIIPLPEPVEARRVVLDVAYTMGDGMQTLTIGVRPRGRGDTG